MLNHLLTRGLSAQRWARRDRGGRRPPSCPTSLHSYRPLCEVLEDRTLLSFITAPTYAAGPNPQSVAVGDLNGDGHLDIAVVNQGTYPHYTDGSLSVVFGKGDGTFQAAESYAVRAYPASSGV